MKSTILFTTQALSKRGDCDTLSCSVVLIIIKFSRCETLFANKCQICTETTEMILKIFYNTLKLINFIRKMRSNVQSIDNFKKNSQVKWTHLTYFLPYFITPRFILKAQSIVKTVRLWPHYQRFLQHITHMHILIKFPICQKKTDFHTGAIGIRANKHLVPSYAQGQTST